ncbi:MAG: DnaJ C-terminal domain-containing protein, partial [Thermaurantiacus tibetensis]
VHRVCAVPAGDEPRQAREQRHLRRRRRLGRAPRPHEAHRAHPGGPAGPGDALVTLVIQPDSRFTRDGDDIRVDLSVPLATAVLGGQVRTPVPDGDVMLSIAPGTSSGKVMRLSGKGWTRRDGTRGDLLARVMVEVPVGDAALEKLFRDRQAAAG